MGHLCILQVCLETAEPKITDKADKQDRPRIQGYRREDAPVNLHKYSDRNKAERFVIGWE